MRLGPEWKVMSRVGGLGMEMGIYLLLGVKGGEWLDGRFDTAPVLQRIGIAVGLFAGFYAMWKLARNPPTLDDPSGRGAPDGASPRPPRPGTESTPDPGRKTSPDDDASTPPSP